MVQCSAVALFRKRYKGLMRPMTLKSRVRNSLMTSSNPPCLGEMTAVMGCWKLHNFDDTPCRREIEAFNTCTQELRANPEAHVLQKGRRWTPEQVNLRLRKFAWAQ